jgi:hypothetical protein
MTTAVLDRSSAILNSVLDDNSYPYDTPGFYECWWRCLSIISDIPYKQNDLLVQRKKLAKGLFQIKEARIAGWRVAWSQDLTAERVESLKRLQKDFGWDYFRMTWSEDRDEKQRLDLLKAAGYNILQFEFSPEYIIDLSNGFEAYLKSLSHNGRKALKKKVRVAQELNPRIVPITDESEIVPFYEEFFSHHIPYWAEKNGYSYFSVPAEREFTLEWAKVLYRSGVLKLDRLVMNDETVSLSMGIQTGKTFYWVLTINTGLHNNYSPGMVSLAMRTEALAKEGIETFNMGAGDYFYKVQSASRLNACREIIVINPNSWKGKLYQQWLLRKHPEAVRL